MITPKEKQVLTDLVSITRNVELPMILVGAGARLLIFDSKFGEGRSTKDWDVAISIDSWQAYQDFCDALIEGDSSQFEPTRDAHRFKHIKTRIDVDIIPFGKIGEPDQQIIWVDTGNPMNVSGFTEALLSAKTTKIDDLEIQVVDTPAFVVLKIFAWGDRGERTKKDLEDIEFILSKYEDEERAYEELAEELAGGVVDFLDISIYLLGRDIARILQDKTLIQLNSLLNKLIRSLDTDKTRALENKVNVLQKGINAFQ